ncbi:asparagine synthase-related protein [Erythrobacter sp. MTPC3]|uniref:asparagine synthase-related protein n=1 Tax=Erythrobacter sp. MTPC3 TaxID=3056564 RepID=UPI0036F3A86F
MSGIGIEFWHDGRAASIESANRMTGALRILGSDKQSSICTGPFAISWTQSAGFTPQDKFDRQPAIASDRWHVLFIGRLNHREELAGKLDLPTSELDRAPDSVLALKAWIKWGEGCIDHLYGSVSMIVCDTEVNRLVALRGHELSQQIYYHRSGERTIVSSSTKGIFSDPEITREIDEIKVADALVLNHQDVERSFFKDVSIVGSGQILSVTGSSDPVVTTHDCFATVEPVRFARDDDYVDRARELLDAALESAFRSPRAPALSLSSGLDSTCLAVAMIERMRGTGEARAGSLRAYTGVPEKGWDAQARDGWLGDESGPVRALAEMYPELDVHFESGEHLPFDHGHDMTQSYADMPLRGVGASAWGSAIVQQARMDGRSVIVTGSDGNGTISFAAAHILFAVWARSGRFGQLAKEIRAFAKRRPGTRQTSVAFQAFLTNAPDWFYDYYMQARGHAHGKGFRYFSPIHPDYANDMKVGERLEQFGWDDRFRRKPDRREMMRIMMQRGAHNDTSGLLEAAKVNTGVEGVHPLRDLKLARYCYAIPDDQFYKDGVDRRLIRRMMAGKLPQQVLAAKRGEQSSDWHARRKRDLDRIAAELDRLRDIPSVANRLDIERMQRVIAEWPDETPTSADDYPEYAIARYGIGRALSVARFINQVEGRN